MSTKNLPEDVLIEILLRLPVKSLVRFRCVSKRWLSLILDRQFAKSHFKRSDEPTQILLVSTPLGLGSLEINEPFAGGSSVRELIFPLKQPGLRVCVLGSCNGLVFTARYVHKDFYIWNPSTGDRRKLVDPGISHKIIYKYGFGYDSTTDDCKLLVAPCRNLLHSCRVKCNVFSLKRNSWKSFQGLDCPYDSFETAGIFSNGALHWQVQLIEPHRDKTILAFDLAEEIFRKVPMPMDYNEYWGDFNTLQHIGGRLCFTCCGRTHIELWGLMEYGVPESWARMFKVSRSKIGVARYDLTPLCFSRGGQLVAIDSRGELIRANPTGEIVESFLLCRNPLGRGVDVFVESLLSPHDYCR